MEILCHIFEFIDLRQIYNTNNAKLVCKKWYEIILYISKEHRKTHILHTECTNANLKETLIANNIIQNEIEKWKLKLSEMFFETWVENNSHSRTININCNELIIKFTVKWYKFTITIKCGTAILTIRTMYFPEKSYDIPITKTENWDIAFKASYDFRKDNHASKIRDIEDIFKHVFIKTQQLL
jgi:hypothetical protein